jgi:hypothetical protein
MVPRNFIRSAHECNGDFLRRSHREHHFLEHPIGVREITGLTLTTPVPLLSIASQRIVESGMLSTREGPKSLLENWIRRQPPQANRGLQAAPAARLSIVIGLES